MCVYTAGCSAKCIAKLFSSWNAITVLLVDLERNCRPVLQKYRVVSFTASTMVA
jgi:hypothetical protein